MEVYPFRSSSCVLILVLKVHKNIGTRVLTLEFYILSVENVL